MGLELDLPDGGDALKVSQVFLTRALGEPVCWRFAVEVTRDERGGQDVERLARLLLKAPIRLRARWRGTGSVDLGPEATVVGARWQRGGEHVEPESVDLVEIDAETTTPDPSPDPFLPRRRVHRAKNMRDLVRRFANVAQPVKGLLSELGRIEFPDKDKTSIIQDGVSDWLFFAHILDQCQFLSRDTPKWLPLTLVGGVDENQGTAGRWVLTPGLRAAYQEWGDIDRLKIRFRDGRDADGDSRIEFCRLQGRVRVPKFPSGSFPGVIWWRPQRHFDAGRWQQWRTMDLPRFDEQEALVWRIEDRVYQSGLENIGWETKVFSAPLEAQVTGPVAPCRLRPWLGFGTVDEASAKGPWIRVRLPGFQSGEDIADVRLTTPFSGTDGKKGLHFVPARGTEIKLAWSGRFDASVALVGNARSQETEFASPSVYLEDTFTTQYEDIHCRRIGDVTVDSNLSVGIKQQTQVSSTRQLRVQADGADLKMTGGTVYTGRGM